VYAGLAFVIGILVAMAGFLFFAAVSGTTYYGIAIQIEETLAVLLVIIAIILGWIFYTGIKAQFNRVKTGKEALIGAKGIAVTDLKPKGEVRVLGEFWEATAKDASITVGQAVEVLSMDGMVLVVKAAEQKP
jgi:membrane-bound ClpP family serine protease